MTDRTTDIEKSSVRHVEEISHGEKDGADDGNGHTMGTVKLTEGAIVYVPTPTADPQGMLYSIISLSGHH